MLLLFTTFLFINTEVWQVASSLSTPVLWLAVAFFAALAVGFLVARLPEEVAAVNDEIDPAAYAGRSPGRRSSTAATTFPDDLRAEPLARKQRVNLLLVLLVTQMSQVLLLAVSVWVFFLTFGRVAIEDSVVRSWVGQEAPHRLPFLPDGSASPRSCCR